MTTYTTSYVLEGDEIPIYRRLLENWALKAKGSLANKIEQLIHNTYDATGETVGKVEERLRLEIVFPFWDVMDAEFARVTALRAANLNAEADIDFFVQLMQLERVIDKIKETHVNSTHS